jgi:hypothetical protein
MAQYFQELFIKVWTCMQNDCLSFYEAEKKELAVDHAVVGAHVAERWALPRGLIDAIRWHEDYKADIPNSNFVMIIYLANILVNSYDENPDCAIDMATLHPDAVKFLMRHLEDIADWYHSLTDEIEAAYSLFLEPEF